MQKDATVENIQLIVYANGNPARKELNRLDMEAQKLRNTMRDNKKGTEEYIKANDKLKEVTAKMNDIRKSIDINKMTLRELSQELNKLKQQRKNIDPITDGFRENAKAIKEVIARKKELETGMGSFAQSMSRMKDQFVGFGVIGGVTLFFTTLYNLVTKAITGTSKLSDELAEIQRTTGLSSEGVKDLNKELGDLNTRTTNTDLRKIAAIGGQFGVVADDLDNFTEAVDKVNVVMGKEFSGVDDMTTQISGLRNVLGKSDDISKDIMAIANAETILAQEGIATAPIITDIANRVGGYGISAGLTKGQVLGLAAATQELNIGTERGSTAIVKILQKMLVNVEEFAEVAGIPVKDFKNLLNNDLYGAFIKVMEGSKKLGVTSTTTAKLIKELELQGAGASEVFSKFGANTELLNDKVQTATTALKSNTAINAQFAIANNNSAASVEKFQKKMGEWFLNNAFTRGIQSATKAIADFFTGVKDVDVALRKTAEYADSLRQLESSMIPLIEKYDSLNAVSVKSVEQQSELNKIIQTVAASIPGAITEFDKYGNAISINTDRVRKFIQAEKDRLAVVNKDAIKETLLELEKLRRQIENPDNARMLGQIAKTGTFQVVDSYDPSARGKGKPEITYRDANDAEIKAAIAKYQELNKLYNGYLAEYNNLTGKGLDAKIELQKSNAKIEKAINDGLIEQGNAKLDQVDKQIKKIKELHSEFFKLTGYETEKDFFDAMEKENNYQDKLKQSRSTEEFERQTGFSSLNAMGEAQGDADVQANKDASDREKKAALEEQQRQAQLNGEKDLQKAQAETFDSWFNRNEEKINKTINDAQLVQGFFVAFDNLKRVKENQEIARLGENSEAAKRIRIEQAKREKKLALTDIAIKTAVNIVSQWPNPLMMALAAATGVAQAAAVTNAPIPEAKYGKKRVPGPSHAQGGMDVIDNRTGKPVLNMEGNETILPGATTDVNEPIIDALLNNYGKPLSMDWLYKNTTANVKGFTTSNTTTVVNNTTNNNQTSSTVDGMKELTNSVKSMEKAIRENNNRPIYFSMYELKRKQKEIDIIERNAGSF